jgi:N-acetylneuraminate synthase
VKFEDTYLLEIARMRENYGDVLKDIGYSGHHLGIAIDIAAYTLGANVIERHFTLNRSWKGTDHAASLEPDDLKRLKINLDATFKALKCKEVDILDFELEQKKKLKFEVR